MSTPPPKLQPPPNGDEHRGSDIIVPQFIFGAVATVLVFVRLYVRAKMVRLVGWDDWLIFIAWVSHFPTVAFSLH